MLFWIATQYSIKWIHHYLIKLSLLGGKRFVFLVNNCCFVYFGSEYTLDLLYLLWQTGTYEQITSHHLHHGTAEWWLTVPLSALITCTATCHQDTSAGYPKDSSPVNTFDMKLTTFPPLLSLLLRHLLSWLRTTLSGQLRSQAAGSCLPQIFLTLHSYENRDLPWIWVCPFFWIHAVPAGFKDLSTLDWST